ncbi:MAG TPA: metallophosphoesterase [Candidatus Polarisedimenticolaceae bacterium]|nr:metallophosphoesterase [Candidatus Polarisedimenticolaceae bacterium]
MRLVLLGDIHHELNDLDLVLRAVAARAVPVGLALLAGDLGVDPPRSPAARQRERESHDASVRCVLERVAARLGCPVVFVPGNHDLPDPPAVEAAINADRRIVEAAQLRIAGFGGAGPDRFGFPYEWSEDEAELALEELFRAAPRLDVLLCHTPPMGTTLDPTYLGKHVGSRAVSRWIPRVRPRLFVCGHIHEAAGVELIEGIPCVNAGSLGPPFPQRIGWVVDWESGPARIESLQGNGWRSWPTR